MGRVNAVSWVGREARKIVIRWHWKLAFMVWFPLFVALVGALSRVCSAGEHIFEHWLAPI